MNLIEQKQYFVIHAARQSGKMTLLKELAQEVSARGNYYCPLLLAGKCRKNSGTGTGHSCHHEGVSDSNSLPSVSEKYSFAEQKYEGRQFRLWGVE